VKQFAIETQYITGPRSPELGTWFVALFNEKQQQQQHSFFPQASWGRLEMKPKRNKGHGSGTLIASF